MASSLMSIPDHLKAEIFVRLPEPEDLARTAATCVTFRRVVADGSFRRRFCLLHAPPLLGILDRDGFHPALAPHPFAPAARALAHAADFTFSFLPSHRCWAVQDVRDGRVLLAANPEPQVFTELVVCDPLHQRHILLPQVPNDLAASPEFPVPKAHRCHLFIASPGAGENVAAAAMEEAARAFIVVMISHCETGVAAFVFSSSTRQWRAAASKGWTDLFPCQGESAMMSSMHPKFVGRHYAYGCFYLESTMNKKMLVFDTRRMEFSIVNVPHETSDMFGLAIVETEEDMIGMFDIHNDLRYYIRGNNGESSSQWKIKKTISLPSDYQYYIQASTERYLLLRKIGPLQSIRSSEMLEVEYVSMDLKTLKLERVCGISFGSTRWALEAQGCARLEVVVVLFNSVCSAAAGGPRMLARHPQFFPRPPVSTPMATNKKGDSPLTEIRDHLLAEIFLRLPTQQDLARACATCVTFRRIITDGCFRRLHAPSLLGFLGREGFHPALPPHATAPAACTANLSFSFLPSYCNWIVRDIARDPYPAPYFRGGSSSGRDGVQSDLVRAFQHHGIELRLLFEHWIMRAAASQGLRDLLIGKGQLTMITPQHPWFLGPSYACGCVYWNMEHGRYSYLGAGGDRLGMFGIPDEFVDVLCYIVNQGENLSHWQAEKTISLDYGYQHSWLFISFPLDRLDMENFSLDVQTLQLERVWGKPISAGTSRTHLYTNFPPSLLSSPRI
ncbi:hypothetical protein VPH35_132626 [Triticum aestivum]